MKRFRNNPNEKYVKRKLKGGKPPHRIHRNSARLGATSEKNMDYERVSSSPKRSRSIAEIDLFLRQAENLKRAMAALSAVHCPESLLCLTAIHEWEQEQDQDAKESKFEEILERFVKTGSEHEICLSSNVRDGLMEGKIQNLDQIKQTVISELRFNSAVLSVLNQ